MVAHQSLSATMAVSLRPTPWRYSHERTTSGLEQHDDQITARRIKGHQFPAANQRRFGAGDRDAINGSSGRIEERRAVWRRSQPCHTGTRRNIDPLPQSPIKGHQRQSRTIKRAADKCHGVIANQGQRRSSLFVEIQEWHRRSVR